MPEVTTQERTDTQDAQQVPPFTRHVRIAHLRYPWGVDGEQPLAVYATIKWDGKRLSITGVEGPKANGHAWGSCGQVTMNSADHVQRIPEYDQLAEVWERWHLNDMNAACEHQRAEGWGKEDLELVTYHLTKDAQAEHRALNTEARNALLRGEAFQYTPEQLAVLALPFETTNAPDADSAGSGRYEVQKRETKLAGWVRPEEHPRGVLAKPCPVCGYKYGTSWLYEEVPADVLRFLATLEPSVLSLPGRWGS
jgi:hypothetical protein